MFSSGLNVKEKREKTRQESLYKDIPSQEVQTTIFNASRALSPPTEFWHFSEILQGSVLGNSAAKLTQA